MSKEKLNRVVYRFWHNKSTRGCVGYIGKDSKYPRRANLSKRIKDTGCSKLYQALNKYPLKFWKTEVLASGFRTIETLNKAEIFYIRKFDSRNKGYNITKGGDGGPGWRKGRKLSLETKKKLSRINQGRNHPKWGIKDSLKTRLKKSRSSKGNRANLGKRFSTKHKLGIANAQKAAWANYSLKQKLKRCATMRRGWACRRARLRKIDGRAKTEDNC